MGIIGISAIMTLKNAISGLKLTGREVGLRAARLYGSKEAVDALNAMLHEEQSKMKPDKGFAGVLSQAMTAAAESDISATIENR